jgi:pSer/pThr/pTyr-binding forkhead associated (FHA) protein
MDGLEASSRSKVLSVGRGRDSDLSLPMDAMISSQHACITRVGRHHWLEDVGSRNGTYVGGQRIESRMLIGPGAKFSAGRTTLEFMPG